MEYITVEKRKGRWWFVLPDGRPFFSNGLNHIDWRPMLTAENLHAWKNTYSNSVEVWIHEALAQDLTRWGFNTIGWVQEITIDSPDMHRHTPSFSPEQYRAAGMPYCHMLPFIESHQWDPEHILPDVRTPGFADWCEYVARTHCTRLADDRNLIGYFYTDCPCWVHARTKGRKTPMFDPDRLHSDAGRRELSEMASCYYRVTHDAIRRYDPDHLILGDRYEANQPLPDEVVKAAIPYVDVISVQDFAPEDQLKQHFSYLHNLTGLPMLLGDAYFGARDLIDTDAPAEEYIAAYRSKMETLLNMPYCVGWHVCGSYLQHPIRRQRNMSGCRNERCEEVIDLTIAYQTVHAEVRKWEAALLGD